MAFVRQQTVVEIADALGAPPLSADAAASLAPHADVRLREVVQDALKAARACKRATLTRADVDAALAARGEQPLLGWAAARDGARFARAAGYADLFYVDDPEIGFDEIIDKPLPPPPLEVSIVAHWLAVNGVQPKTPENAPLPRLTRGRAARGVPAPAAAAGGLAPAGGEEEDEDDDALFDDEKLVGPSSKASESREREQRRQGKRRREQEAAAAAAAGAAKGKGAAEGKEGEKRATDGGEGGDREKGRDASDSGARGPGATGAAAAAASSTAAEAQALADAAASAGDLFFGPSTTTATGAGGTASGFGVFVRAPVRHALSEELAAYLEKVASALLPGRSAGSPSPGVPAAVAAAAAAAAAGGPPGIGSRGAAGQVEAAASEASNAADARARERASEAVFSAVLASLGSDPGLHQLSPYLVKLIADGVRGSLDDAAALRRLCRAAGAIASNPGIKLGPYLHRLLPALMTCLVARKLGRTTKGKRRKGGSDGARTRGQRAAAAAAGITRAASQAAFLASNASAGDNSNAAPAPAESSSLASAEADSDDHWATRDAAASALSKVVQRYGRDAENVPARLAKALLATLGDGGMPLASHYGAVVGLGTALGRRGARGVLLPALASYAPLLEAAAERAASAAGESRRKKNDEADAMVIEEDPEKLMRRAKQQQQEMGGKNERATAPSASAAPSLADVERVRGAILRVARAALYGAPGSSPAAPCSCPSSAGAPAGLASGSGVSLGVRRPAAVSAAAALLVGARVAGVANGAKTPSAAAGKAATPASSAGKKAAAASKGGKGGAGETKGGSGTKRTRAAAAAATKATRATLATRKSARTTRGGGRSREATPADGDDDEEEEGEEEEEEEENESENDGDDDSNAAAAAATALRQQRKEAAALVLSRAWREDSAVYDVARALHELFGEASAPATAVAAGLGLVPL